jgi:hypothetical protein
LQERLSKLEDKNVGWKVLENKATTKKAPQEGTKKKQKTPHTKVDAIHVDFGKLHGVEVEFRAPLIRLASSIRGVIVLLLSFLCFLRGGRLTI